MWIAVVVAVVLGGQFALAALLARRPRMFARFAILPVGKHLTLPLPPAVVARVLPLAASDGDYRVAPPRRLALEELPGPATALRAKHVLEIVPGENVVLARSRKVESTVFVRVDVGATEGGLSLRARRLPLDLAFTLAMLAVLAFRWGAVAEHPGAMTFVFLVLTIGFVAEHRASSGCVNATVEELKSRIAQANGDIAAPAPPKPPRSTLVVNEAGEWVCACGKANKPKRTMCARCWAQRPA